METTKVSPPWTQSLPAIQFKPRDKSIDWTRLLNVDVNRVAKEVLFFSFAVLIFEFRITCFVLTCCFQVDVNVLEEFLEQITYGSMAGLVLYFFFLLVC